MPQLVPFYFLNQISLIFMVLTILTYVLYKYILPNNVLLMFIRKKLVK